MGLFFSVIVIAYKRMEYLKRAVTSVLRQDYPKEDVQIVVVKAFNEPSIDRFLMENNVDIVFSDSENQGKSLADALSVCRGDVICLLDDDDLFAPNKLSTLYKYYSATPDITVAVNSYNVVDSSDAIVESDFGKKERTLQSVLGFRIWKYPEYDLDAIILELNMLFNSSRISFRREIVSDMINISKDIAYMVDILPVTLAINLRKSVASIPEKLTMYRIHNDNISLVTNLQNKAGKLVHSHKRIEKDCSVLESYFREKNFGLSNFFHLWKLMEALKIAMLEGNRKDIYNSLLEFILVMLKHHRWLYAYRTRLFTKKTILVNIVFAPIFLIFGGIALKLRLVLPF